MEARLDAQRKISDLTQMSSERAVAKAEAAMNERLAAMNEFREALRDASLLQMPRSEVNVLYKTLTDKADNNAERITALESITIGRHSNAKDLTMTVTVILAIGASILNLVLFFSHLPR
jgi:beta-lactamase regulating signal transducer with metallopeptidase domain